VRAVVFRSIQVELIRWFQETLYDHYNISDVEFFDNGRQVNVITEVFPTQKVMCTRSVGDFSIFNISFSVWRSMFLRRYDYAVVPCKNNDLFGMLNVLTVAMLIFPRKIVLAEYKGDFLVVTKLQIFCELLKLSLAPVVCVFFLLLVPLALGFSFVIDRSFGRFKSGTEWRAGREDI
jgi:hypothetical protein